MMHTSHSASSQHSLNTSRKFCIYQLLLVFFKYGTNKPEESQESYSTTWIVSDQLSDDILKSC